MANIKANRRTLIRWKIYIDRARMYIGYIQFMMIIFLLIEPNRDTMIGELIYRNLFISVPVLLLAFVVLSLIIGRLDTSFGLREEELRNFAASNPVMREIRSNMEEIKHELKELREQREGS